jgi:hypothetical protein
MSTLRYVRIIRMGSMVEPGAKGRSRWTEREALRDGDWIEGTLIKPVRIGDGLQVRILIYNSQLCRRLYLTSDVVAIQGDQVLTTQVRYKFLRVPVFDPLKSLKSWD